MHTKDQLYLILQSGGEVERYVALPNNEHIRNKWVVVYDGISRANDCINAILNADDMTEAEKNVAMGQAKFLRALLSFQIAANALPGTFYFQ